MTALLDTNVVLDVLLDRQPFVVDSKAVWQACDDGKLTGYITATTLTTIYYIVEKTRDRASAVAAIDICLNPDYSPTLAARSRSAMAIDFDRSNWVFG